MRTLIYAAAVIFILLSAALISCKKKEVTCKDMECLNYGSCEAGVCTCPTGFTGRLCETKINYPTSNYIDLITRKRRYHSYITEQIVIWASDDAAFSIIASSDITLHAPVADTVLCFDEDAATDSFLCFTGSVKIYKGSRSTSLRYYPYNDSIAIIKHTTDPGGDREEVYYSYQ